MKSDIPKRVWRVLSPSYDEVTVLLMTLTLLALCIFDATFRSDILVARPPSLSAALELLSPDGTGVVVLIAIPAYVSGLLLSLYHAFNARPISSAQKRAMLFFAMATNGLAGVAAGVHMWRAAEGLLLIFPIWNMISGLILLYQIPLMDESSLGKKHPSHRQLVLGVAVTAVLFVLCHVIWDLYWAYTFSICVIYATTVNDVLGRLFRFGSRLERPKGELSTFQLTD